jgi:tetratricopeptide (TPR) repeat protein
MDPRPSDDPTDSAPAPSGDLGELPLPLLLLDLHRIRYTGLLELLRSRTTKRFILQDGSPVASESNLKSETLGLQLIDQDVITRQDHNRVSRYMEQKGCREGVALLALQLLKPKELFLALKEQVRRRVIETFAWSEGNYQLDDNASLSVEVQPFRTDSLSLVREGLISHWTPDRLLSEMAPLMEQYPTPGPGYDGAVKRLGGMDVVDTLIGSIDGKSNLGAAIGSGFSSIEVLTTAWILWRSQSILFTQEPVQSTEAENEDSFALDIEIEVVDENEKQDSDDDRAAGERGAGAADGTNARNSANDEAASTMRSEVLSCLERLDNLSYYELLSLDEDCAGGEIRKAYFSAAKRYHPDALTRLGLTDIKEQAAQVFARIAEANDVLKDDSKRSDYDASLRGEDPQVDVNALAQAETFYRKGQILLRMGDFRGSLEFFKPAVDLWPDETAYQAALGWALYKQPKSEPEEAAKHLEIAAQLDSDAAEPLFRLGVVLRSMGDEDRGAECMAQARILDPDVA